MDVFPLRGHRRVRGPWHRRRLRLVVFDGAAGTARQLEAPDQLPPVRQGNRRPLQGAQLGLSLLALFLPLFAFSLAYTHTHHSTWTAASSATRGPQRFP